MSQVTSLNHYVPRGYLARWSADGGSTVWEHKLAVPHVKYPLWRRAPLREACSRENFYDAHIPGLQRDHFERWLKNEVEDPAYRAIHRLEAGEDLSLDDWNSLVRFAVAQDARTPKSQQMYAAFESSLLPTAMDQAIRIAYESFDPSAPPPSDDEAPSYPDDEAPVVEVSVRTEGEEEVIEMSMLTGSTSWMQYSKRMVREFTHEVSGYMWQVVRPHPPQTWPTCDHPLVRLERKESVFIHGTGWLRPATEIFLPLTPHFGLYSKVGETRPLPFVLSRAATWDLVRLVMNHAHRSIFTDREGYKWIEWESRRRVDREDFNRGRP